MNVIEALVLGLLQGLTEFIPVSSSGHLALVEHFLKLDVSGQMVFNVAVHVASLAAVFLYFRKDIFAILTTDRRVLLAIVVASVPAAAVGFLLKKHIEAAFDAPGLICGFLIVTGIILFVSERLAKERTEMKRISTTQAALIGVAQAVAILPGISRSGSTIGSGLLLGLKRDSAVKFSFLMSIPVIAGAGMLEAKDFFAGKVHADLLPITIGALASFVASLFAIKIVEAIVGGKMLSLFAWYCVAVGTSGVLYFSLN